MKEYIKKHFSWTPWERVGEYVDNYKKCRYELFSKTNGNNLKKYKNVLMVKVSCHSEDLNIYK